MFLEKQAALEEYKARITEHKIKVRQHHDAGALGYETVRTIREFYDVLIHDFYQATCAEPDVGEAVSVAVLAVGGYGRGELNPCSDIDLIVVTDRAGVSSSDQFAKKYQYWFYDTGIKIGYQVMPLSDLNRFFQDDIKTKAALLEARFLCGQQALFDLFLEQVKRFIGRKPGQFYQAQQNELISRKKEYGDSVYVQEPDLKNGLGGLRDFHFACWVAKPMLSIYDMDSYQTLDTFVECEVLTEQEAKRLKDALSYVWWLRSDLHFRLGNDLNLFTTDLQLQVCQHWREGMVPFMRKCYAHMWAIHCLSQRILERVLRQTSWLLFPVPMKVSDGMIFIHEPQFFCENPQRILKIFLQCKQQGLKLSQSAYVGIEAALPLIDEAYRDDKDNIHNFLELFSLKGKGRTSDILRMMSESGFFGAFLPDWAALEGLIQDKKHFYTVGEHTLQTLEKLQRLYDLEKEASEVEIFNREELIQGLAFLNDIHPNDFDSLCGFLISKQTADSRRIEAVADVLKNSRSLLFSKSVQNVAEAVESTHEKINAIIQILDRSGIPSLLRLVPYLRNPNTYEMVNVLVEIKNPLLLWWGLILHDIGKVNPYEHVNTGVAMSRPILDRLGIVGRDAKKIELLIKVHTRMTAVIKQDYLRHPDVLSAFAEEVISMDRLRMLYILTYCDMDSVNPNVWNKYNAGAIRILFENTEKKLVEGFDVLNPKRVAEKKHEVLEILKQDISEAHIQEHVSNMPDIYFHNLTTFDLSQHIRMVEQFRHEKSKSLVCYETKSYITYHEVVVIAESHPGLLAHVVGVFSYLGFNIRSVMVYTREDGIVVDVFRLDRSKTHATIIPLLVQARLRQLIEKVVSEKQNKLRVKLGRRRTTKIPTEIGFDNSVTQRCTIISIYTADRKGLLYHLGKVLSEEKLDISYARIGTEGMLAMDAFYVTDKAGNPVTDEQRLKKIEDHLRSVLDD